MYPWPEMSRRAGLRSLAAVGVTAVALVLGGCGTSKPLVVSVVSPDENPVPGAVVDVRADSESSTTDQQGSAPLKSVRSGVYRVIVSAPGYYTARETLRLLPNKPVVVPLKYRLPVGVYVFDIGPDSDYWEQVIIGRSGGQATEFDWTCSPGTDGKEVGRWESFRGETPHAIAPNELPSAYVRQKHKYPSSGPPPPRSDCSAPVPTKAHSANHAPFYAVT